MVNLAILNALKKKRQFAEMADFEETLDRVKMGVGRTSLFQSYSEKLKTAYHEAGHTLTSILTQNSFPVHKVTI